MQDISESEGVSLTVVMPALNEEQNIAAAVSNTLAALDDLSISGEILVINDGSTDKTSEITSRFEDPRVRLINHEQPHGIGGSFWDGVDNARGDYICMLPGDNENDPWEILRYYSLLKHVDVVIPFVFNKERRSLFRNALSFAYRFIINTTFLVYFNYTNGTVMYRRAVLADLSFRNKSFFFQTDILVRAVKRGYLFAEVPYRLDIRPHGVSKAVSFPSLLQVVRGYIHLVKGIYFESKDVPRTNYPEGTQTEERRQSEREYKGRSLLEKE